MEISCNTSSHITQAQIQSQSHKCLQGRLRNKILLCTQKANTIFDEQLGASSHSYIT